MWGAYFCMGAYKHDMVVVIKMGAYIHGVLIFFKGIGQCPIALFIECTLRSNSSLEILLTSMRNKLEA